MLSEHQAEWAALAVEYDKHAVYLESRGESGVSWRHKAETARRAAQSLKLEADTGVWHCVCCLKPKGVG